MFLSKELQETICSDYRRTQDISIISQLNGVSKKDVCLVLEKNGLKTSSKLDVWDGKTIVDCEVPKGIWYSTFKSKKKPSLEQCEMLWRCYSDGKYKTEVELQKLCGFGKVTLDRITEEWLAEGIIKIKFTSSRGVLQYKSTYTCTGKGI